MGQDFGNILEQHDRGPLAQAPGLKSSSSVQVIREKREPLFSGKTIVSGAATPPKKKREKGCHCATAALLPSRATARRRARHRIAWQAQAIPRAGHMNQNMGMCSNTGTPKSSGFCFGCRITASKRRVLSKKHRSIR